MQKQTSPERKLLRCTLNRFIGRVFFVAQRSLSATPVFSYTRTRVRALRQARRAVFLVAWALLLLVVVGVNLGRPAQTAATTSGFINFQARLEGISGAIVPDGNYNVEFKMYSASSGGSAEWTEDYTYNSGPGASDVRIKVVNGYLTANLGSITAFPGTINWDTQQWLTMNIGGTGGTGSFPTMGDGEMNPRLQLTAVPYAFRAGQLALQTGANESTLGFATQTTANSLLLPNEGGTLCVEADTTNCGFAPLTGSTNYIQNTSSVQASSNFNISGNGTIGGNAVVTGTYNTNTFSSSALTFGAASAATIQAAAGQALNILAGSGGHTLNLESSGTGTVLVDSASAGGTVNIGLNATTLTLGGTGANTITIGNTQTGGSISLGAAMTGGTISIGGTGLQTGTINLGVGTGAQAINLGTGGTGAKTVILGSIASTGTTTVQGGTGGVKVGTGGIANTVQIGNTTGAVAQTINIGNNATASSTNTVNIGSTIGTSPVNIASGTAGVTIQGANTTSALQIIQNSTGASLFNADTTNQIVSVGSISSAPLSLSLPGISGSYASTPDSAANSVTGDIDLIANIAPRDWSPANINQMIIGKRASGSTQYSYLFFIASGGRFDLNVSSNGTSAVTATSSTIPGYVNGSAHWVRVQWVAATSTATFYTSVNGVTWTQLGTTAVTTGVTALFDGTAALDVGADSTGGTANMFSGNVTSAQVWSGDSTSGGTLENDFEVSDSAGVGSTSWTSSASTAGETWTVNGTAAVVGAAGTVFTPTLLNVGTATLLQNASDSTTAFQIQNAADTSNLFIADTANSKIGIGGAPTSGGSTLQITGTITASGLITGTAGLTVTGAAVNLDASSNFATNINTGTSTGQVSIGGGSAPLSINSTHFDVSTAGALSGITSYLQGSGSATFDQNAADQFKIVALQAPTTDMADITNSGFPTTTAGVNGLQIDYYGGAAAVESGALRVNITPGSTSGGTWDGLRVVGGTAASGVTQNGIKIDNITGGAGAENALYVGTGWDNILQATNYSITQAGAVTEAGTLTVGSNTSLSTTALTIGGNLVCNSSGCLAAGGGLAKNAVDTSTAAVTALQGDLYAFTNSSSGIASGVLSLDNGTNTNSALSVTASGNPSAGQALIFASDTNASPTGNLLDLQAGSSPSSVFSVSAAGNVTLGGTSPITIQSTDTNGTLNVDANGSGALNLDTTGLGTVSIASNAATLNLANSGTATNVNIGAALIGGNINIGGTGAQTGSITIGNGTGVQSLSFGTGGTGAKAVTVGSAASTSTTILQGGTGSSVQLQSQGTILIGNNAANQTVTVGASGSAANTSSINLGTSTGAAQTITIGSTNTGSNVTLTAGGITQNLTNTSDLIQSTTNSTTAFQIQNAGGTNLLNYDTSLAVLSTKTFGGTYIGGADVTGSTNSGTGDVNINQVVVSGGYEYTVKEGNATTCSQSVSSIGCELQVYNVSNPAKPTYVGGADSSGTTNGGTGATGMFSIAIAGHYAYIGTDGNATACSQTAGSAIGCELQVYDISNPAAPTYVGGADISGTTNGGTGNNFVNGVVASGRYVYLVTDGNATACSQTAGSAIGCELQAYNISNPTAPAYIGGADVSGTANGGTGNLTVNAIAASGRYVYTGTVGNVTACSGTAGSAIGCELQVYDMTNPAAPAYLAGTDSDGTLNGDTDGAQINSISASGNYIYVDKNGTNSTACSQTTGPAEGCELMDFNVTNPAKPTYVGGADSKGSTNSGTGADNFLSVYVTGHYAYVAKQLNGTACSQTAGSAIGCELQVYDVSNPAVPAYLGGDDVSGSSNSGTGTEAFNTVFVSGNYLYTGSDGNATACSATAGSAIGCDIQSYNIGGVDANTVMAGSLDSGSLQVDSNASVFNQLTVGGGLTVGQSLDVQGDAGFNGNFTVSSSAAQTAILGGGPGVATVQIAGGTAANVITIGNLQTAGSISLGNAMTSGTISIGGGAAVRTANITIGSTGTTSGVLKLIGGTGTGVLGGATSGVDVLAGTAGTINIGAAAGTGAITLGASTAGQTVKIGVGAPAALKANIVSIGTTVSATTGTTAVNIGATSTSTNGATSVTILAGNNSGSTVANASRTTTDTDSTGIKVSLGDMTGTTALCAGGLASTTAPTSGTAYELIDCSGTPIADYAEEYPVAADVQVGDVVATGTQMVNTYDSTNGSVDWTKVKGQITQLIQSNQAYQPNAIGIVSDNTGDFSSTGYNIKSEDNPVSVALNGRVPVNVTTENGPIEPGDYLTTSATHPGYAMRATQAGYVIGQALAAYTSSDPGQVMTFVKNTYYPGPDMASMVQNGGDATLSNLTVNGNTTLANLDVAGDSMLSSLNVSGPTTLSGLTVTGDANVGGNLTVAGSATIGGSLTVTGVTNVADIVISGHVITAGGQPTPQVQAAAGTQASITISGTDSTGTITITTGNHPTAGAMTDILFSKAYGATPRVVLSPSNDKAAALRYFKGATTTNDFMFNSLDTPVANTTYQYDYFIAQ